MQYDIAIIGAGPVGLCLARAFADLSLKVALVERQPRAAIAEPDFDGREIALTHASMRLLRQLGVWERIDAADISPLRVAQVMNLDSPHMLRIDGALAGHEQLGSLLPNHAIRRAAWQALQDANGCTLLADTQVASIRRGEDAVRIALQDGSELDAALLVAADSRFSETRRAMGIDADMHDFGKSMLVCRMHHQAEHYSTSWQWFGEAQTLALLPLREHLASVVVTVAGEEARRLQQLPAEDFARQIESRFDHRLGAMRLESTRHVYPLVGVYARRFVGPRFALAGDAAVGMHPVTAHGFNLGLASVERLAGIARIAVKQGRDPGSPALLERYQRRHRAGTLPLYLSTRALVGLYTDDRPLLRPLRETVLRASARLSPFRRAIAAALVDEGPIDATPAQRLRAGLARLRPGWQ